VGFVFKYCVIGNPSAVVGAYLSCPHIRKHPRNEERKYVCGDVNICILKCGHTCAMKWIYGFDNVKMRIWLCKDTGTMNLPLRLAVCLLGVSWCVRSVIGSPSAAVGADLSRPHIWKHPQNEERKYVCGDLNIRILKCGNVYLLKWIHVFDNARTRARWICPYALRCVR